MTSFEQIVLSRLDKLEKLITKRQSFGQWMSEEEAMELTGLGKSSLRNRRKSGELGFSTATGRKIKYLRRDIEKYLDSNSTLVS